MLCVVVSQGCVVWRIRRLSAVAQAEGGGDEGPHGEMREMRERNQEFDWGLWDFLGERER